MARHRNGEGIGEAAERGVLDERRQFLAAASLFLAVTAVLLLGAWLRNDVLLDAPTELVAEEPTPESSGARPGALRSTAVSSEAGRITGDEAPAAGGRMGRAREPVGDPLTVRAASDLGRLVRSGGSYTVQLMVACDPDNARRVVRLSGDSSRLYLLPFTMGGRRCYRLCWGSYASRAEADAVRDLSAALRAEFPSRRPRTISDLSP